MAFHEALVNAEEAPLNSFEKEKYFEGCMPIEVMAKRGIKMSTGGVYRGYRKDFYPGPWLLGEWQKMGGKVIITSDSHDIASLTYGFDEAAAAIKAAGFTSVEVLTGHGFETQEL